MFLSVWKCESPLCKEIIANVVGIQANNPLAEPKTWKLSASQNLIQTHGWIEITIVAKQPIVDFKMDYLEVIL